LLINERRVAGLLRAVEDVAVKHTASGFI